MLRLYCIVCLKKILFSAISKIQWKNAIVQWAVAMPISRSTYNSQSLHGSVCWLKMLCLISCHGDHTHIYQMSSIVIFFSQPHANLFLCSESTWYALTRRARHTLSDSTSHRESVRADPELKDETAATTESTVSTRCCANHESNN